jgi:hypothetical protein
MGRNNMARYADVSDLKRLGRIRNLPEAQAYEPYPETAQPQNCMGLIEEETSAMYQSHKVFKYLPMEGQHAN